MDDERSEVWAADLRLIPSKYRCLSGSALKLLALITMVIDHTASVLLRDSAVVLLSFGSKSLSLYQAMRTIGRLAFPLYAFLLVEGFQHTRDRRKYGFRLLAFALISEIPWNLEHSGTWTYASQNVFFTLFLGFLGLCLTERLAERGSASWKPAGALIGLFLVSVLLRADYGCTGFGFILLLYLLRQTPLFRAVVGAGYLSSTWKAGIAFIPISLYNGKRGFIQSRTLGLVFYAVYPLHILLLYFIKARTIGY